MNQTELKTRIREHYDRASPLYRALWGSHIHHGYWTGGMESKERAQEQLIDVLAERAGIAIGECLLDVGCGMGATAVYLAERFGVRVVGITISPVQAAMALQAAAGRGVLNCCFAVMDAEQIAIHDAFDVVWAVESISHMSDKTCVLSTLARLLRPGGRLAIVDWFKREGLSPAAEAAYIEPIEKSMLIPELKTTAGYLSDIENAGCRIVVFEDISSHVSRTWELCAELIRVPSLWRIAHDYGSAFVEFLRGFRAMKAGYRAGAFRYGLIVGVKS